MFGRIRWWLGGRRREADMRREFEAHLQTEIEEHLATGMSAEEARRAALRDFGNVARIREDARAAWVPRGLDRLRQDLDYAARMLRRNPGLAAVAVLSLALGIGVNTVVFSIVESVLLRPFPFPDVERVALLRQGNDGASQESTVPGTVLLTWQTRSGLLEGLAPYQPTATESVSGEPVRVSRVGHEVFDVLGVRPLLGPGFLPESESRGPSEVVLSYGFWQSQFGGDPGAVGRTLELNGDPKDVVGVMPEGVFFPEPDADIWFNIPSMDLSAVSALSQFLPGANGEARTNAQVGSYLAVVRLRPDASWKQAQAELDVTLATLEDFPDDEPRTARLIPVRETVVGEYRLVLWTLLGAVSVLLLLASSNVASLLLARGMARQKELAIRTTLGAGRGRLVGQLVTESLLLAAVAGAVAVVLAWQGIDLVLGVGLIDIPRINSASMNWAVVVFALAVSVVAGLISGLLPAWRASRVDLNESLKLGRAQTASQAGSGRLRDVLVVSQVAMALTLLIGTGLLVSTAVALARVDWGFDKEGLTVMTIDPEDFTRMFDPGLSRALAESVTERLRAIPGVESAAFGVSAPLVSGNVYKTERVLVEGASPDSAITAESYLVGPDYFRTLGVAVRGQGFGVEASGGTAGVILSESLAERLFPGEDPVGRTIDLPEPAAGGTDTTFGAAWDPDAIVIAGPPDAGQYTTSDATRHTVVGVAPDFRMRSDPAIGNAPPAVYIDVRAYPLRMGSPMRPNKYLVRSGEDLSALMGTIRARLGELDAPVQFRATDRVEDLVSRALGGAGSGALALSLSVVFGALALMLAAVGVYGAMSQTVARRIPEFGIRIALGARRSDILRLVLEQSLKLTLPGLLLGLMGAWAATRLLASLLFGVTPTDPTTFAGVTLFLLLVAATAGFVPAVRASVTDPLTATRAE